MGRSHSVSGLLAGVGMAACVPSAPVSVRCLIVAVVGGASVLPDIDTPQSSAARSLGLLTRLLARGVDRAALSIYHATKTRGDSQERHTGHRGFTHTVPAAGLAGLLVAVLAGVSSVAAAVAVGLVVGLLGVLFGGLIRRVVKWVAGCFGKTLGGLIELAAVSPGLSLFAGGGYLTWRVLMESPGWAWCLPLSVFVGCLVHTAGDWATDSGAPILWPLVSAGKRWRLLRSPVPFSAGDSVETGLVRPLLVVGLVVAVSFETGLAPAVLSVIVTAAS